MNPVPSYLHDLVDDAAIFPPGDLPVPDAAPAHHAHRAAWYAPVVGPFVIDDRRLGTLAPELVSGGEPFPVSIVATGGAGSIDPAVRAADTLEGVRLASLECALRARNDLAATARRVCTVLALLRDDGVLADDTAVYVEVPLHEAITSSPDWQTAADELAAADLRLKFRTGGPDADAFPAPRALAAAIEAAIDREAPFKCTAGLHHALPHRDPDTGFEHLGFLTVLLATRAGLDGAGVDEVAEQLARTDAAAVVDALREAGPDALSSARRWFRSFGSCSIAEPVDDLVDLGLLTPPSGR